MHQHRESLILQLSLSLRSTLRSIQSDLNQLFSDYMPMNEFLVLHTLFQANSPKMASEVSEAVRVSSSHITSVSNRLAQKGYITRGHSDSDRRVVYLQITDAGREVASTLDSIRREYYTNRFGSLQDEEIQILLHLLHSAS